MPSMNLLFYALRADLVSTVIDIERAEALQYIRTGLSESPKLLIYGSIEGIPELGTAKHGDATKEDGYLVMSAADQCMERVVERKGGERVFAVDQIRNPRSVVIQFGGRYGSSAVIQGNVGTASTDPRSIMLLKEFRRVFSGAFSRIRGTFVGPAALEAWKAGSRLTMRVAAPQEYDLAM